MFSVTSKRHDSVEMEEEEERRGQELLEVLQGECLVEQHRNQQT